MCSNILFFFPFTNWPNNKNWSYNLCVTTLQIKPQNCAVKVISSPLLVLTMNLEPYFGDSSNIYGNILHTYELQSFGALAKFEVNYIGCLHEWSHCRCLTVSIFPCARLSAKANCIGLSGSSNLESPQFNLVYISASMCTVMQHYE